MKRTKALRIKIKATGAIQRNQAVRMRPQAHRDIPGVACAQQVVVLCVQHGIVDHVGGGRAAGAEVFGVAAGIAAAGGECVVEQMRVGQRVIQINALAGQQARAWVVALALCVPVAGDFVEAVIADAP